MKTEFYLDYPTILANQARPVNFAIRFAAELVGNPRPKPAAFCAVLDRSGSMAGSPLAHAKEAAKVAVRNLRPGDRFSLVIFDDEARTVIPLQPATSSVDAASNIASNTFQTPLCRPRNLHRIPPNRRLNDTSAPASDVPWPRLCPFMADAPPLSGSLVSIVS